MQRTNRFQNFRQKGPVVEDLREKLNRKKQEKALIEEAGINKLPPPDPPYNFLRDPLRGDCIGNTCKKDNRYQKSSVNVNNNENKKFNKIIKEKYNEERQDNEVSKKEEANLPKRQPKPYQDIYRPPKQRQVVNIKVELSTEGIRTYTFDKTKTVQIPLLSQYSPNQYKKKSTCYELQKDNDKNQKTKENNENIKSKQDTQKENQ